MQESATNLAALGFWIFLAVVVVGVMWTHTRRLQLRKELIQSMLEMRQPIDVERIDRLLAHTPLGNHHLGTRHRDPRSAYRMASFVFFLVGFVTLFVAFRQQPIMYLLALLGALPLTLAASVWYVGDREYAAGTLPTLKYSRDPREPWQHGGGWFFWIGYATIFVSIFKYGMNLPLIGLGIVAIVVAFWIWANGNREYAAGKIPLHAPATDDKPE